MLKILSIDFPFLDEPEQAKIRPGLALTKPIGKYDLVIVAYITSHLDDVQLTDVMLRLDDHEYERSGLTKPSLIMLHKVTSVMKEKIHGELGTLPEQYEIEVKEKLRQLLAL